MLIKPTLFLRNEEGASPGGGTPAPAPAPAPANGAAAAPAITADLLREALAPVMTEMRTEIRNGVFAELRKAGALGKEKPNAEPAAPAPAAAPAPSGPTLAEIERTVETKLVVQQMLADGLTESQVGYLKAAIEHSKPDNIIAFARSWRADLGLAKAPTQPVSQPATAQTPSASAPAQGATPAAPIKAPNLGAPAPGDSLDVEALIASQPLNASSHDFENLAAKVGRAKAEQMVQASVNAFLKTVRIVPENRRRR